MSQIISHADYLRMAGILAAVVDATGTPACRGCVSFAMAGSLILRHVYHVNAVPLAGAAFYRVDDSTGFTMAYGNFIQGKVISDESAFHCWIDCDGEVIDLMAPLFQENLELSGRPEKVPARVFQRPLSAMSNSPLELEREGDFFLEPNLSLSHALFTFFLKDASYERLADVCVRWFEHSCSGQADTFEIPGRDGKPRVLRRRELSVEGVW